HGQTSRRVATSEDVRLSGNDPPPPAGGVRRAGLHGHRRGQPEAGRTADLPALLRGGAGYRLLLSGPVRRPGVRDLHRPRHRRVRLVRAELEGRQPVIDMWTVEYLRDGQREWCTVYAYPSGGVGITASDPGLDVALGGSGTMVYGITAGEAERLAGNLADAIAYLTDGDIE